jgi:hypothetical protein
LNSLPLLLSPISPALIPGMVSTNIIFAFTYMCIHCLYHVHPPTPFPSHLPPPTSANLTHPSAEPSPYSYSPIL